VAVVAAAFTAHRHQKFERTGDAARLADGRKPVLLIAGADAGYVDGAACIGCHRAIWESYRQTGMGRSLSQLSPGAVIADFERNNSFYHQASDRYYTMYRKDGQYYERRHQIGFDGKETNVIEQQIDFVIGSGNHARTYLHRTPDGKLVELPVAWYAEKGGHWAMNPGFDNEHHSDFRRQVMYECVFCHTGYPEIPPAGDRSGMEPLFPGHIPLGIDCQRCHGPGRDHIRAAGSGKPELIRSSIVDPRLLSTERQLELCMQCHLETTSARLPHTILRFDRGAFSYRPGEPLANFVLHFDHAPGTGHDDKFEIAQQAYRLRKSACFEKSGGKLICTTCHDPHTAVRADAAAEHYASVCRGCHAQQMQRLVASSRHTAASNCIECHMPKRRTDDVVHVVMTDHYIQRRKPARDLVAPLAERQTTEQTLYNGPVVPYYPQRLPPEDEIYAAVAQVKQSNNLKAGIPQLAAALRDHPAKNGEFYFELAEAYAKNGQNQESIHSYQEALRREPNSRPAWLGLGRSLSKSGEDQRAIDAFQKALAAGPVDSTILSDLGLIQLRQGRAAEALKSLRGAVAADPEDPSANNNLGSVLRDSGDSAGAEQAFRNAIRSQPDFASAHENLANLLADRHDFAQAEYHYRKAIFYEPKSAAYHQEYGTALAGAERFSQAREQFEAAVRLHANSAEAHSALADMQAIEGNLRGAVEHYKKALVFKSDLASAELGLGSALAAQGGRAEAIP